MARQNPGHSDLHCGWKVPVKKMGIFKTAEPHSPWDACYLSSTTEFCVHHHSLCTILSPMTFVLYRPALWWYGRDTKFTVPLSLFWMVTDFSARALPIGMKFCMAFIHISDRSSPTLWDSAMDGCILGVNMSRMAGLVHQLLAGAAPAYLADDCHLLSDAGRRPLRSHSDNIRKLLVPRTHNKLGDRSFSAAGPRLWNDLPPGLRRPGLSFDSFRRSLKTHLFGNWSA